MKPQLVGINIRADCPDCGIPTTFEYKEGGSSSEFGSVIVNQRNQFEGRSFLRIIHKLYRCSVCSRPGVATVHFDNDFQGSMLESFWPTARPKMRLPDIIPNGVANEFREAESCMSVEAWRGAAALLRSTLEKVLHVNGFNESDLYKKIQAASEVGVITSARRQRAQDLVRVLGNDVLHQDWRIVTRQEVEASHHYVARIIEDLYDDRATVESILKASGRQFTSAVHNVEGQKATDKGTV